MIDFRVSLSQSERDALWAIGHFSSHEAPPDASFVLDSQSIPFRTIRSLQNKGLMYARSRGKGVEYTPTATGFVVLEQMGDA